jgi:hypothetical protein
MKKISTIFGNYWNDCPSSCSGPEGLQDMTDLMDKMG